MSLLQWKPEYSVGIDSMDDEHRELIGLINTTYDKLHTSADATQVEECLGEIMGTISMHFALEERIMQKAGYGEYRAHKDDHEDLLDRLADLMNEYYEDPVNGARELEASLSGWFEKHFASFDARLHGELGV